MTALALPVAALLSGCAGAPQAGTASEGTTGAGLGSGLEGTATKSPTTPVCRVGEPCSGPYAGPLEAVGPDGEAHAFASNATGAFRVGLSPGHYTVRSPPGQTYPRCAAEADVAAGAFTHVDIGCDTGIR